MYWQFCYTRKGMEITEKMDDNKDFSPYISLNSLISHGNPHTKAINDYTSM
jgi:hypothetical protein